MEKIINNEKLEKILTALWTDFLDYRKVIAFIMASVRDNINNLPVHQEDDLPKKGVEIAISRFSIKNGGFLLWIDFTIPRESGFAIGTCECHLSNLGELQLKKIVGQILIKAH